MHWYSTRTSYLSKCVRGIRSLQWLFHVYVSSFSLTPPPEATIAALQYRQTASGAILLLPFLSNKTEEAPKPKNFAFPPPPLVPSFPHDPRKPLTTAPLLPRIFAAAGCKGSGQVSRSDSSHEERKKEEERGWMVGRERKGILLLLLLPLLL